MGINPPRLRTGIFLSVLLAFASPAISQVQLVADKLQTVTIRKTDRQRYSLRPKAGASYLIEAEQRGIDVELRLMRADGTEIARQDSPNGKYGPEAISFDGTGATLLLEIIPLPDSANAARGKVSVLLRKQPPEGPALDRMLSPSEMSRDLRVFRQIREQANSGFLRYRSRAWMDSLYTAAAARARQPLRLTAFYKIILELTDAEGSCHNSTELPEIPTAYLPKDRGYFPFYLKRIGSQLLVNEANREIPLGARILSIDGVPDTVLSARFSKYFATDGYNRTQKDWLSVDFSYGWRYPIEFGVRDSFRIAYRLNGEAATRWITLPSIGIDAKRARYQARHSAGYEAYFDSQQGELYPARRIDSATMLLHFRTFGMAGNAEDPAYSVFTAFLDSVFSTIRAQRIGNLIIDIRNNPGGSDPNYEKVFTYLSDRPFRENTLAYISFRELPLARHYRWNSSYRDNQLQEERELNATLHEMFSVTDGPRQLQNPAENPVYYPDSVNHFEGRLYLLIDANVASAASHFASLVRSYSKATIVGVETTGGYYGHNGHFPVQYVLPESKIRTKFSIVWVEQDVRKLASQPPGRGIIPDVVVEQSYEDFMANEDTQLKAVLRMIGEGK